MSSNILKYKGYTTKIHYSAEDQCLYGKIENLTDLVSFESDSAKEIEREFHDAVNDYINTTSNFETMFIDMGQHGNIQTSFSVDPDFKYGSYYRARITKRKCGKLAENILLYNEILDKLIPYSRQIAVSFFSNRCNIGVYSCIDSNRTFGKYQDVDISNIRYSESIEDAMEIMENQLIELAAKHKIEKYFIYNDEESLYFINLSLTDHVVFERFGGDAWEIRFYDESNGEYVSRIVLDESGTDFTRLKLVLKDNNIKVKY